MTQPLLIIVNGAHARKNQEKLNVSFGRLQKANVAFHVIETTQPGHARLLAKEAFDKGQRNFVAAGGDGTSFEIINGLFPAATREPVSLGFLPLGTGNSFVRDFSDQAERYSIEAIIRGRKKAVDVAVLSCKEGELYFINILSLGLVAHIGRLRNRYFSCLGHVGYSVATLLRSLGSKSFPLAIETEETRDKPFPTELMFASFCNSRYTGGDMLMAPAAKLDDGRIDVITSTPMDAEALLRSFPQIFKGTHVEHPSIRYFNTANLRFIDAPKQAIMIDGEILDVTPLSLRMLPGALTVLL